MLGICLIQIEFDKFWFFKWVLKVKIESFEFWVFFFFFMLLRHIFIASPSIRRDSSIKLRCLSSKVGFGSRRPLLKSKNSSLSLTISGLLWCMELLRYRSTSSKSRSTILGTPAELCRISMGVSLDFLSIAMSAEFCIVCMVLIRVLVMTGARIELYSNSDRTREKYSCLRVWKLSFHEGWDSILMMLALFSQASPNFTMWLSKFNFSSRTTPRNVVSLVRAITSPPSFRLRLGVSLVLLNIM